MATSINCQINPTTVASSTQNTTTTFASATTAGSASWNTYYDCPLCKYTTIVQRTERNPRCYRCGIRYSDYAERVTQYATTYLGVDWGYSSELELSTSNKPMTLKTIPATIKRLLNPELQAQYRAGFLNGDLELTDLGRKETWAIIQKMVEKELAERANEVIAEAEKEK